MAKSSVFPKSVKLLGDATDPIQNLWRNVLITALEDALARRKCEGPYTHFAQSAREYFTYPNRDFKMVCELAGFDHQYIRMKTKDFFENKVFVNGKGWVNDEKDMRSM